MLDAATVVPADRVPALLPLSQCIDAVEGAFRDLARGQALQPLRTVLKLPDGESSFLVMPGATRSPSTLGCKLLTLFPGNHDLGIESHQGVIVLFDPDDGSLAAIVDAAPVTALRTAASSALATRILAREDAGDLALLGSGVQAGAHLEAMQQVRPIRRVRVWSPNQARRERFAAARSAEGGQTVEPMESAYEAVDGADLICTVTSSPTPVLKGDWIRPGAHINAVGASTPETREVDTATVRRSRLYVDRRESALAEAGDLLIPIGEGAVDRDWIVGEIGEVLEGSSPGRRKPDEITLFKSLGMAVQDLVAAGVILERLTRGS